MAKIKSTGKYARFWEMLQGGPGDDKPRREIFKCTECGAETHPENGWNGEPDVSHCAAGCGSRADWYPGRVSARYRENYDKIFRKKQKESDNVRN